MAFSPELLSGSDRPQTRGAGACGNKYFSTSALGITLARQTAVRGLDKQQASPAEQNALQPWPVGSLKWPHCVLDFQKISCSEAVLI